MKIKFLSLLCLVSLLFVFQNCSYPPIEGGEDTIVVDLPHGPTDFTGKFPFHVEFDSFVFTTCDKDHQFNFKLASLQEQRGLSLNQGYVDRFSNSYTDLDQKRSFLKDRLTNPEKTPPFVMELSLRLKNDLTKSIQGQKRVFPYESHALSLTDSSIISPLVDLYMDFPQKNNTFSPPLLLNKKT